MFRPSFSYSTSDGTSSSTSAAYNAPPYNYVSDPLSQWAITQLAAQNLMVNTRSQNNISYTKNKKAGGMLQLNRRLSASGRNVTLRADVDYADTDNKSLMN